MFDQSTIEATTFPLEIEYSPNQIVTLVACLDVLKQTPQFVRKEINQATIESPYDGLMAMLQAINNNSDKIIAHWPKEAGKPPENLIQTLLAATLLSDIGKAGDPNDPISTVIPRIYLQIFQMGKKFREMPVQQALAEYQSVATTSTASQTDSLNQVFAPLTDEEIHYLQRDDLLGPDFDPNTMIMGEFFTKLHLLMAKKLFTALGIESHPEAIIALSHHFDQGENPANLSLPPDETTLNCIAFISIFDKLHASICRGGNPPETAITLISDQITKNLNHHYPNHAQKMQPIYNHWLNFFKENALTFFPSTISPLKSSPL